MDLQCGIEFGGLIHRGKTHPLAELGVDDLAQEILETLVGQPSEKVP